MHIRTRYACPVQDAAIRVVEVKKLAYNNNNDNNILFGLAERASAGGCYRLDPVKYHAVYIYTYICRVL